LAGAGAAGGQQNRDRPTDPHVGPESGRTEHRAIVDDPAARDVTRIG
jgi:hypothetical protein